MKKDNKGFSLVELIVVVLIMGILAVALTPQVMKWVNNSRISSDVTNYDALVDAAQLAMTDKDAYKEVTVTNTSKVYTIVMSNASLATGIYTQVKEDSTALAAGDDLYDAIVAIMPGFATTRAKVSEETYTITIKSDGSVERTDSPNGGAEVN